MSIKVKCPGCTKTLTVPDAARGKAVKCPSCETRVAVPADDDAGELPAAKSKKPAKSGKRSAPVEDEAGLAGLDLRKVADHEANVCPKCGYDLDTAGDEDEEITECPQCGWDVAEGGMGVKARKRALKGPDPDKFYKGLWKNSWAFVFGDLMLSIRTFLYIALASVILSFAVFMYLWVSMWPPRYFFALVSVVAFTVIPGWFWFLDTEIIKLTLERKDKFKRLNFDFFVSSALGVKFVIWNVVFAGPLLLIPGALGWALWYFAGLPLWVGAIILAVSYLPIMALWPVVLTHMTMPIQAPAWKFWKMIPIGLRCVKPLLTWFMLFVVTNLPVVLVLGATAFFTAPHLVDYVDLMERNAEINRVQARWESFSSAKNKPKDLVDPKTLGEQRKMEVRHLVAIGSTGFAWMISCVILSLTALFNMRTNGTFAYYFRERLDLQVLIKEYKYVATISREKDEHKVKTTEQVFAEAAVSALVLTIIGLIFGMLYGALSDFGIVNGIVMGLYYGGCFTVGGASVGMIYAAFNISPVWGLLIFFSECMCFVPHIIFMIKEWEDSRPHFFQFILGALIILIMIPIIFLTGIWKLSDEPARGGNQQNQVVPGGDMPDMPAGAGKAEGAGAAAIPANPGPATIQSPPVAPAGAPAGEPKPGGG